MAPKAQATRATNAVAAGESGIAGPTVDSLVQDIYAQEGRYDSRVDKQLGWTQGQLQQQKTAASYQMKDRINSLRDVAHPSFIETGLKIGSAALDSFSDYNRLSKKTEPRACVQDPNYALKVVCLGHPGARFSVVGKQEA